jgi:hypothetical protein
MNKCKWFGHKWGKWKPLPIDRYNGILSIIREQKKVCVRCGKAETEYV